MASSKFAQCVDQTRLKSALKVGLSGRSALAVLFGIVSGLTNTATMVIVMSALNGNASYITLAFLLFFIGLSLVSRSLWRVLVTQVSQRAVAGIREQVARRVLEAALVDIETIGPRRIISAMTLDARRLADALPIQITVLSNLSFLLGCLAYLSYLSPRGLLLIVVVLAIGGICYRYLHRQIHACAEKNRQIWDQVSEVCSLIVNGLKQLKGSELRRAELLERLETRSANGAAMACLHTRYTNRALSIAQVLFFVPLCVALFAPWAIGLPASDVLGYGLAMVYMVGPLREAVAMLPSFADIDVARERIKAIGQKLDDRAASRARGDAVADAEVAPLECIELRNIRYSYTGEFGKTFSLESIDLVLRRGEILFVVGGNGTGKTTLAKILAGLYVPTEGELVADGEVVGDDRRDWYQRQVSVIFNDFVVFDRVSDRQTEAAVAMAETLLQRLEVNDRVGITDLRYSRTTGFSSGERKRLALLSACVDDRPVVLLDEWAADQDPRFKEKFYREFLIELRDAGKLVVVISHDDRYFDVADRLLFLERGGAPRLEVRDASAEAQRSRAPEAV